MVSVALRVAVRIRIRVAIKVKVRVTLRLDVGLDRLRIRNNPGVGRIHTVDINVGFSTWLMVFSTDKRKRYTCEVSNIPVSTTLAYSRP